MVAKKKISEDVKRIALRTAFVSRFIVLREGRRSRAHRKIEKMSWFPENTAEELSLRILKAFEENGDDLEPIKRDLSKAMKHAKSSINHFAEHYCERATDNFLEALEDYMKSNKLLFGDERTTPRFGGWKLQLPPEQE